MIIHVSELQLRLCKSSWTLVLSNQLKMAGFLTGGLLNRLFAAEKLCMLFEMRILMQTDLQE